MPQSRKAKKRRGQSERPSRIGTIKATVFSLFAAASILYVAAYLFARTEGFRALVSDLVEKRFGERIEIGTSRCTWNGGIVLGDLRIADPDRPEQPLASAAEMRVEYDPRRGWGSRWPAGLRRVEVRGWSVSFRPDAEGVWRPAALTGAGPWLERWAGLDLPEMPVASASESEAGVEASSIDISDASMELRGGRLAWTGSGGEPVAEIRGAFFLQTPLAMPGRTAVHYRFGADAADVAGRTVLRGLAVETLRTGGTWIVLDLGADRSDAVPVGAAASREPASGPVEAYGDAEMLRARIRAELEDAMRGQ